MDMFSIYRLNPKSLQEWKDKNDPSEVCKIKLADKWCQSSHERLTVNVFFVFSFSGGW